MGRPLRIEYAGALYHIISRGNNRERVFQQEEDFEKYLERCTHLLIEAKENSSLSKIMQEINLAYSMWLTKVWGFIKVRI
jgi:REP element-mobilizing transposase RayT